MTDLNLKGNLERRSYVHFSRKVLKGSKQEQELLEQMQKDDYKQDIKEALAQKEGVAVTSEEHAVEFERKSEDLKEKTPSEVEEILSEESDDKTEQVQVAKRQQTQIEKDELVEKIEKEIRLEQEKASVLFALENARKNAIDAARASYGPKADIRGIQMSFDAAANSIDPQVSDWTDELSMGIDNQLHRDSDTIKMLMPNGSIRVMDADVAMALSDVKRPKQSDVQEEMEVDTSYSVEALEKLDELSTLMDENQRKQALFAYKDPNSGALEARSKRLERFRTIGLPTVAMDYDYVYHLDETTKHNGRPLPSAMDAYDMQPGHNVDGKTYIIQI